MFPYYEASFNYYLLHILPYQYHKHINKSEFAKRNEITEPKGSIQLYWRVARSYFLLSNQTTSEDRKAGFSVSKCIIGLLN